MPSYVEEILLQNEEITYRAHLSKWAYFWRIFFGVILFPFIIGVFILFGLWVKFTNTELAVTNLRVVAKFGFIRRNTFELDINRVEGIQIHQTFFGRIFNFGTLRIGGTGNADPIPNISHPMAFQKAVMESQNTYRHSSIRQ